MPATFSQQLRYLRRNEPSLYESISKAYRKCLMESNLAPEMSQTDDEAAETPIEKTEIKQSNTKGVDDLMSKVHAMVGVNETKKEGEEIFDLHKDDVETVKPDPEQQADLLGQTPPTEEPTIPESTPAETPTEESEEFDFGNFFPEDTENTQPNEQPAEEPVAAPAEEPPAETTNETGGGDIDLDNFFPES